MFRVISANLNGIRSAASKGFFDWMLKQNADVVGVQEVKAQHDQVTGVFDRHDKMAGYFHYAEKKGYSGVGLYSRHEPSEVVRGIGNPEFDAEGRWVELRFDTPERKFSVVSCYFPSGSSGDERQQAKYRFLDHIYPHLMRLKAERQFILVGDVNIAHKEADLKNWKGNLKNSGFLPEERAWMTRLLGDGELTDVYRTLYPHTTDACYTWWSNRGQAYAKNVGWRIDYFLVSHNLLDRVADARILPQVLGSDHCPVVLELS